MASSSALVGLDIGGSKTAGLRVEAGEVVREAEAGSASLVSVGEAEAGRQLDALLERLGRDGVAAVCAGAAGADSPEGVARLARLLGERLPGAAVRVVHDTQLILAAAEVEAGVAVIAGTGSVAWGIRLDGVHARAGGWGYLLGDEGSGYGVAREAVRQVLGELDRAEPVGPLAERLLADCGLARREHLLDHFYATPERRYWAQRARVVFELEDEAACRHIAEGAADALTGLAATVAGRLGLAGPVVLAGGLAVHQPRLQELVRERLGERGIRDVRVLDKAPVLGAVRLAERLPPVVEEP